MKLLLATTSRGKLREQRRALEDLGLELVSLDAFPDVPPPDEPGPAFRDNAREKALYYHERTGLASVGEDAGLVVDALGGDPGVQSARWLGSETSYEKKNARLLELLEGIPPERRTARYVSAVALAIDGRIVFEHVAMCEGAIALEARGTEGFGYDPVFYHPPLGKTMAEMTAEEKEGVSHRGKAMRELRAFLETSRL